MAKKKKVTIETLAGMVQRGFTGVDKRFDVVYKRFDSVDKRIDSLEKHMNDRFNTIEKLVLADHKRRIDRLERDMKEIKEALAI